jgi:hypothetical protein
LDKHIDVTKAMKDIAFSGARNSLLKLNLQMSAVAVALAVG